MILRPLGPAPFSSGDAQWQSRGNARPDSKGDNPQLLGTQITYPFLFCSTTHGPRGPSLGSVRCLSTQYVPPLFHTNEANHYHLHQCWWMGSKVSRTFSPLFPTYLNIFMISHEAARGYYGAQRSPKARITLMAFSCEAFLDDDTSSTMLLSYCAR